MKPLKLIWTSRPITKKNNPQIKYYGGKSILIPSAQFIQYQDDVGWQIKGKDKLCISDRVNVQCVYYMPTKGIVDLLNLESATLDILVHYGVLKDDNSRIVAGHDGSRVEYDKENPRVEITITDLPF